MVMMLMWLKCLNDTSCYVAVMSCLYDGTCIAWGYIVVI